jgi:hypothetical protein
MSGAVGRAKAAARRRGAAAFDAGDAEATMHALANEILRYREVLRQLARAIRLANAGAPFGLLGPGPLWRPRRTIEGTNVAPPAA